MSEDKPENEELVSEEASAAQSDAVENEAAIEANGAEQPQDEASQLRAQLEAAEVTAGQARDELLRVQAEMQNLRRRTEQDIEKAHKRPGEVQHRAASGHGQPRASCCRERGE